MSEPTTHSPAAAGGADARERRLVRITLAGAVAGILA